MFIRGPSLYICDLHNHRIVVIGKENGNYQTEWGKRGRLEGQFYRPLSIYVWEDIWYIGDYVSLQLFHRTGICLERIEKGLKQISGICIVRGLLCVSDTENQRIRVLRPHIF